MGGGCVRLRVREEEEVYSGRLTLCWHCCTGGEAGAYGFFAFLLASSVSDSPARSLLHLLMHPVLMLVLVLMSLSAPWEHVMSGWLAYVNYRGP
jgi:hypothetical protein